jgi:hypothetical protein
LEYNEECNPIATPAPVDMLSVPPLLPHLRCSPCRSPQQLPHTANNNKEHQQETNANNKGVTPACAMDAHAALRKTESGTKAQKTKNLSYKHKEHTSIVGAIVKLIEQGQGSSSGTGATMSMTLMHQMERINKSMDDWDRREEKERKKEPKRHNKQQAKKKAKKARKRVALEGLKHHGGNTGRGYSSSSSSSSNSEDSDSSSSDHDDGGGGGEDDQLSNSSSSDRVSHQTIITN